MNAWVVRIAVVLALGLAGAWLVSATEWADTEVPTPASGEARTNLLYGVQGLLRELGAKVVKRQSLDAMPPPDARLVLASRHWDMFPERAGRLRAWVEEEGGHLVMPAHLLDDDMLDSWVPLAEVDWTRVGRKNRKGDDADDEAPQDEADEADDTPAPPKTPQALRGKREKDGDCHEVVEPYALPASFAGGRVFRLCAAYTTRQYLPADEDELPLWAVEAPRGIEAIRVRVGRGSVTVMPWGVLHNRNLLRGDNALFAAAALQARAGSEVWFVTEEAREPFLKWLWHQGWVAIVAGLLALVAALWRGAVRFGPLAPSAGTHRRSMAEQVRGTSAFLNVHGNGALHAAQVRALNEAAARHLRHHAQRNAGARAAAIAQATGLQAAALERALATRARSPEAMAVDLELLETARRRLEAGGRAPSSPSSSSSS
ncbi:hypothetical protein M2165_001465 [Variovorax sp. TBS-050B]|uniref:DUF4350 domain-containing protein n=1 Tax=Variovorax sp. TBS-050B TaxID=2940551 RepID=UPI0024753B70|nr:DUF4350 domain-containing protein [Variovorax sp. TBS-050B]MDH6591576.1 hypothetical protein [Variovorax sp. TBS-050B]